MNVVPFTDLEKLLLCPSWVVVSSSFLCGTVVPLF